MYFNLIFDRFGRDKDREGGSMGVVMVSLSNLRPLVCVNCGLFLVQLKRAEPCAGTSTCLPLLQFYSLGFRLFDLFDAFN